MIMNNRAQEAQVKNNEIQERIKSAVEAALEIAGDPATNVLVALQDLSENRFDTLNGEIVGSTDWLRMPFSEETMAKRLTYLSAEAPTMRHGRL